MSELDSLLQWMDNIGMPKYSLHGKMEVQFSKYKIPFTKSSLDFITLLTV